MHELRRPMSDEFVDDHRLELVGAIEGGDAVFLDMAVDLLL